MDADARQLLLVAGIAFIAVVLVIALWDRIAYVGRLGAMALGGFALGTFVGFLSGSLLGPLAFCSTVGVCFYAMIILLPTNRTVTSMGVVVEKEPWRYRLSLGAVVLAPPLLGFVIGRLLTTAG